MIQIKPNAKIALVCRAGPENGPFSAQVLKTLRKGLKNKGLDIHGIFAVSGSTPTALLGCTGEDEKLCNVWLNLEPENIVGSVGGIMRKFATIRRLIFSGNALVNTNLHRLLKKTSNLDKMFSSEALPFKITAVDYLTGKRVVFSNKVPEHKECIIDAVLGSMCLVPWFPSPTIPHARQLKITDKTHPDTDAVFLVDGGYRGGLLVEDAIRDPVCYDVIFVVDIEGLKIRPANMNESNDLTHRIRRTSSIISANNCELTMRLVDRINEEVRIKNMLEALQEELTSETMEKLQRIIKRMNEGRLRLHDKDEVQIIPITNPEKGFMFDFTHFKHIEVVRLMQAGHEATLKVLRMLGVNTRNIPLIDP